MSQVVEHWNEENDRNSKNFLWNYCNNAANLLKTSIYQLAPTQSKNSRNPNFSVRLIELKFQLS